MKILQEGNNGGTPQKKVVGPQTPTQVTRPQGAIQAEMEYVRKLYMLTRGDKVTTERLVGEMLMPATTLLTGEKFKTTRAQADAVMSLAENLAMAYIDRVKEQIGAIKEDGWEVSDKR